MTGSPYEIRESGIKLPVVNLVFALLLVSATIQCMRGGWPFVHEGPSPTPVIDDARNGKSDLSGSYLVIVEESKNRNPDRVKILNDYDFWFGLRDRGLKGFRLLDPDSSDSRSFVAEAAKQSVEPPFVMHVSSEGKVLGLIPFPKQITGIEALFQ